MWFNMKFNFFDSLDSFPECLDLALDVGDAFNIVNIIESQKGWKVRNKENIFEKQF